MVRNLAVDLVEVPFCARVQFLEDLTHHFGLVLHFLHAWVLIGVNEDPGIATGGFRDR